MVMRVRACVLIRNFSLLTNEKNDAAELFSFSTGEVVLDEVDVLFLREEKERNSPEKPQKKPKPHTRLLLTS